MRTWLDGDFSMPGLDAGFRISGHEGRGKVHYGVLWSGDAQVFKKFRCEQLIDQNPMMLGVVLEFDNIPKSVTGMNQVSLRTTTNSPKQFNGVNGRNRAHSGSPGG